MYVLGTETVEIDLGPHFCEDEDIETVFYWLEDENQREKIKTYRDLWKPFDK